MEQFLFPLFLATIGPILGSLLGVLKKPSETFMFNMLSFAGGVMLSLSFLQLIPQSIQLSTIVISAIGIIFGSLFMFALDRFIPHIHPGLCVSEHGTKLKTAAIYLLLGISLHNLPEGMAIAIGTTVSYKVTLAIALALAIHDIPEGICTSAPYYYATKKRLKSFLVSAATAIPTLFGFFIAYFLFQNMSDQLLGMIIAATAGIMVYISADELIPISSSKMTHHSTIFSLIAGIVVVIILISL